MSGEKPEGAAHRSGCFITGVSCQLFLSMAGVFTW
jgi:hypothetical protein